MIDHLISRILFVPNKEKKTQEKRKKGKRKRDIISAIINYCRRYRLENAFPFFIGILLYNNL